MATTIESTGYIVFDNEGVIHGTGETADKAWTDFRDTMRAAQILLLGDDEEAPDVGPSCTRESAFTISAASAGLLALVNDRGGNCMWDTVGGVACTRDESGY